ncbi:hypothetical protein MRX96_047029 [Rhipicephalus microplus]
MTSAGPHLVSLSPLLRLLKDLPPLDTAVNHLIHSKSFVQKTLHFGLRRCDSSTVTFVKLHELLFTVSFHSSFQFPERWKFVPNFHFAASHHTSCGTGTLDWRRTCCGTVTTEHL